MPTAIVLGGCGVVGSVVVKVLAQSADFDRVLIGDINLEKAQRLASDIDPSVSAVHVDANDVPSVRAAIQGTDVVVNCIGPYYRYEKQLLSLVIDEGINYVDVCDDTGATHDALALDQTAKDAGVTAVIGMGSSPGVTNLLAHYAATDLLEECESIDMYHIHGGEPEEGPGVIGHRFYCLSNPIPVFLDGEAREVDPADSEPLEEEVEFINLPGRYRVYPYPHPEPITLPMHVPGVRRVTNKGSVLPEAYYELTRRIHACGLHSKEPLDVKGQAVVPYDFAIAYLIKERERILAETNFGAPRGCVKIVVKGKRKRTLEPRTYVFSLVSEGAGKGQALGEGTGTPAAFGAILIQRGQIAAKGVLPPEAAVDPMDFLALMREALDIDDKQEGRQSPVIFESIDEAGNVKRMDF